MLKKTDFFLAQVSEILLERTFFLREISPSINAYFITV